MNRDSDGCIYSLYTVHYCWFAIRTVASYHAIAGVSASFMLEFLILAKYGNAAPRKAGSKRSENDGATQNSHSAQHGCNTTLQLASSPSTSSWVSHSSKDFALACAASLISRMTFKAPSSTIGGSNSQSDEYQSLIGSSRPYEDDVSEHSDATPSTEATENIGSQLPASRNCDFYTKLIATSVNFFVSGFAMAAIGVRETQFSFLFPAS